MNRPKTYTVDDVLNSSKVGCDIYFKSKKQTNFLLEDLSNILVSTISLTNNIDIDARFSPLLCIEYISDISKYILKIPQGFYVSNKDKIVQIITYLNNYCIIDNFSRMRVSLSFDDNVMKTIYKIQTLHTFKYMMCIDEEYINNLLPNPYKSPHNMSVKTFTPLRGVVLSNHSVVSDNLFKIPKDRFFGVDVLDHTYGVLHFNYIGGENWTSIPSNIIKIIEYYIIFTHQQVNNTYKSENINTNYVTLSNKISSTTNTLASPANCLENIDLSVSVDLLSDTQILNTYWDKIYKSLFNLVFSANISKCEYNFDTELDRVQLRGANLKNGELVGYDIIDSEVSEAILINCRVYASNIKNSRLYNTMVTEESVIINSFLLNSDIEHGCLIEKCEYNNDNVFFGDSKNSIIKNSDISHACEIDGDTVILNKSTNLIIKK